MSTRLPMLLVTLVFLLPRVAVGQEPQPGQAPRESGTHRFFDRPNTFLTGGVIGAALADAITTHQGFHKYPESFHEANPIARPLVMKGWPGLSVLIAADVAGELGVRYLFHRKKHHRLERFVPVVLIATHTLAAIHNARELRRYERSLR